MKKPNVTTSKVNDNSYMFCFDLDLSPKEVEKVVRFTKDIINKHIDDMHYFEMRTRFCKK